MSSPTSIVSTEMVRAGAGAGKTTQLTRKVIETAELYKQQQQAWPRFVVTTFTRKATQELRERLILKACEKEDVGLLRFVSSKSQFHISTIHGVLNLFLQKFGHLVGLDTSFKLMSADEVQSLSMMVVKDLVFKDEKYSNLMSLFGLGKLVQVLRSYNEAKLANPNIDFYTLGELEESLVNETRGLSQSFYQISESIKSEAGSEAWLTYADRLLSLSEELKNCSLSNVKDLGALLGKKPSFSKKSPPVSLETNDQLAETLKKFKKFNESSLLDMSDWSLFTETYSSLKELGDQFRQGFDQLKAQRALLEMSDLELLTLDILRREPELAQAFSEEWDYWLIDEFQDTSPIQIEILKKLIGNKPYYVVGDPQQSIYLFRGSRAEVFNNMIEEVKDGGGQVSFLQKNYRSEPELLLYFNDFFKGVDSKAFYPMEPKTDPEDNKKTVAKFLIGAKEEGPSEFELVAEQIVSLLKKKVNLQDICILARDNKTLVSMMGYLQEQSIPSYLYSASGFYSRREVRDALSLLKFLVNPYDNKNLYELLRSPWFHVSDEILVEVAQERNIYYWNVVGEKFDHLPSIHRLKRLLLSSQLNDGVVQSFMLGLKESGILDFNYKIDATGRRDSNLVKLISLIKEYEKEPGANLIQFVERGMSKVDLDQGNEEGDAVAALEPNRVQLMTVHASKGLQFDHVFVVNCSKKPRLSSSSGHSAGLIHNETKDRLGVVVPLGAEEKNTLSFLDRKYLEEIDNREIQESQRLLYVALTRAKKCVYMSWEEGSRSLDPNSWAAQVPFGLSEALQNFDQYTVETVRESSGLTKWNEGEKLNEPIGSKYKYEGPAKKINNKYSVSSQISFEGSNDLVQKSDVSDLILKPAEGVLLHKVLESIKYKLDFDYSSFFAEQIPEKSEELSRGVEYILDLQDPPVAEVLQNGEVEWGYQHYTEDGLLEGQVDLWGTVDGVTWVIDYKSGATGFKGKAFEQMKFYAKALEAFGVEGPIKLAVIYPLAKKIFVEDFKT